jgi:hypothetical protein
MMGFDVAAAVLVIVALLGVCGIFGPFERRDWEVPSTVDLEALNALMTRDEMGAGDLTELFVQGLNARNAGLFEGSRRLQALMAWLTYPTDSEMVEVPTGETEAQRVGEFSVPYVQKTSLAKWHFVRGDATQKVGVTKAALRKMTGREALYAFGQCFNAIESAMRRDLLQRLFTATTDLTGGDMGSGKSLGVCNGGNSETWQPPSNDGETFTTTHDHRVVTSAANFGTRLGQAIDHLEEHGFESFSTDGDGPLILLYSRGARSRVQAVTDFLPRARMLVNYGDDKRAALGPLFAMADGVLEDSDTVCIPVGGAGTAHYALVKSFGLNSPNAVIQRWYDRTVGDAMEPVNIGSGITNAGFADVAAERTWGFALRVRHGAVVIEVDEAGDNDPTAYTDPTCV